MNDPFSRRGFTKLAFLGAAGVWLPSQALAQHTPRLAARIVPITEGRTLTLELLLRNRERRGLELLLGAIHLEGEIEKRGEQGRPIELRSQRVQRALRSRAGFRLGHELPLPPAVEVAYDRFSAPWPEMFRGGGEARLTVRAVLDVRERDARRRAANRAGLRALANVRASANVMLPA